MIKRFKNRGFLLVVSIILIVVFAAVAGALTYMFTSSSISTAQNISTKRTTYIAETGLEKGIRHLLTTSGTLQNVCNSITGQPEFTDVPFSDGKFSVEGNHYQPTSAKLNANINASQTVIPLKFTSPESINSIAPQGRINIGSEKINYGGTSNEDAVCNVAGGKPCLYDAERGADDSTPTSHNQNDVVTQNQCTVSATGASPVLNPTSTASGQQALLKFVIQEGGIAWAVGSSGRIAYFDGKNWNDISSPTNINLYGISMLTSSFGFAVGDSGIVLKYDGSTWSIYTTIQNVNLKDVVVTSDNSAWAVGTVEDEHHSFYSQIHHLNQSKLSHKHTTLALGKQEMDDEEEIEDKGKGGGGEEEEEEEEKKGGKGGSSSVILYWNGSTWNTVYTYNKELKSISITNDNTFGFAVGYDNTILKHSGTNPANWSVSSGPNSGQTLNRVDVVSPQQAWAVGEAHGNKNSVIYWNGSIWSNVSVPKTMEYYAVSMYDTSGNGQANYGFIGGQGGHTLIYNGFSWTWKTSPGSHIYDIAAFASDDAWAVGNDIKYWNGSYWTKTSNTNYNAISIVPQDNQKTVVSFEGKY